MTHLPDPEPLKAEAAELKAEITRLRKSGDDWDRVGRLTRRLRTVQRTANHSARVTRRRDRVAHVADDILGGRSLATLRTAIIIDREHFPDSWK